MNFASPLTGNATHFPERRADFIDDESQPHRPLSARFLLFEVLFVVLPAGVRASMAGAHREASRFDLLTAFLADIGWIASVRAAECAIANEDSGRPIASGCTALNDRRVVSACPVHAFALRSASGVVEDEFANIGKLYS